MYESPTGSDAHECANCGATLPAPDPAGVRTCTFCKAVFQPATRPAGTPPSISMHIDSSTFEGIDYSAAPAAKAASGCGVVGLVITLVVIASIAVPIYFAARGGSFDSITGSITGGSHSYRFGSSTAVLSGEPNAAPSFIASSAAYENGKTVVTLMRFDSGATTARWTSPALPTDAADVPMLADATNVYVATKDRVAAYKLSDGTAAWQGSLSDEHNGTSCVDCFALVAGRVVVRTKDGTLQAFDVSSGAPSWSRRLEDVNAEVVVTGDVVVVRDGTGGDYSLLTLDSATGAELAKFAPTCPRPDMNYTDELSSSSIVQRGTDPGMLLVALGTSPWCIQSWDPRAGAMAWSVWADDSLYFHDDDFRTLSTPAGLVVTSRDTIGIIDPGHSSFRVLLKAEQTEFRPLAASDDLLYVEAVNSRGTPRSGVRALALASGEQRFEFSTGKAKPIDGQQGVFAMYNTSGDGTFSAHVADGRLYVLTFLSGSSYDHTLTTDSIDATTGAAGPHQTLKADSRSLIPDFGPVSWNGSLALARVGDDTMQVVDVATGTVKVRVS